MKISSALSGDVKIANKIHEVRAWRHELFQSGESVDIGFVPTMGALHSGHEKLIKEARSKCKQVVVSIFVNPTQFGPGEDLDKYPRTFEDDLGICKRNGVGLVFHPEPEEIYGADQVNTTFVEPPPALISRLCGARRPGHFRGVATVVTKLFNIVQPHKAFFGQKDYQQLLVVKRLVDDLNLNLKIEGVPTVRCEDGLALSSRNAYLGEKERKVAPEIYKGLCKIRAMVLENGVSPQSALVQVKDELGSRFGFEVEYLEACHPESLEILHGDEYTGEPFVLLVAAKLGSVRLIDNLLVRK